MKLRIEIPDANEDDDWVCHLELPLRHRDLIPELLETHDHSVILPGGETLQVIAQYGKHNGRVWIMINERGTHKASVEALSDNSPPRLIFTTLDGMVVRLSIVE